MNLEKCTLCPDCQKLAIACWNLRNEITCDNCWQIYRELGEEVPIGYGIGMRRIVYAPVKNEEGIWVTRKDTTFDELYSYISECIHPGRVDQCLQRLLVMSSEGIASLLDLLESRMDDPVQEPRYLAAMRKAQELNDYLARLEQKELELRQHLSEASLGRSDAEWKRIHKMKHKLRNVQERLKNAYKVLPEVKKRLNAIVCENRRYHSAQENTLRLLRTDWARTKSPPSAANKVESDPAIPLKHVPWTLLEPKPTLWERLESHYSQLRSVRREEYDVERLRFLYELSPTELYAGRAEFEGYVVFCFAKVGRAVLECPKVGNAIYCMAVDDWKTLSQMSKTELLSYHRSAFSRIIHTDQWRYEVKLWVECGGIPLLEHLNWIN